MTKFGRFAKILALGFLVQLGCISGCVSQERIDDDPLVAAKQAEAYGLRGRLVIIYGNGHVLGQSFNLSGSSGFLEVELDPNTGDVAETE